MNAQTTITPTLPHWISDDGHGWLVVELSDFPDAIEFGAGYGYMDNSRIYLEEDIEAVAFLDAHPEIRGCDLAEQIHDGDAPCRRLYRNLDMLDVEAFYIRRHAQNAAS